MEKFFGFVLCALGCIVGVGGCCAEISRIVQYEHAMTDEQWVGEVLLIFIYGSMAIGCTAYAVHHWRNKI